MNKILQRGILFAASILLAGTTAAATVPNVLSQLPYSYGLGNFPAYQINQNDAYILGYVDTSVAAVTSALGQIVTSTAAPATTGLTTNTPANITSVTLTAGDWDVCASYVIEGAGSTSYTLAQAGLSTVSATLPADNLINSRSSGAFVPPTAIYVAAAVPIERVTVSTSTVVYLVTKAVFTISTAGAGGVITARRIR
jgi:hypothetical protein